MTRAPLLAGRGTAIVAALALLVAAVAGAATLLVAAERAQSQFDILLEEKAYASARRVQADLELAVGLGIPLAQIRGMYAYAEAIPVNDPDIRFVAVTDLTLARLHYGGIGRRRLDPLLADPALADEARMLLAGTVVEGGAVPVGEFAITMLPIAQGDGETVGFVHVAVQARQLAERFFAAVSATLPLGLLALLLVHEIAAFLFGAGHRDPLARLHAMLCGAASGRGVPSLSGRHAGGDLGAAMFQFNAVVHLLSRRTSRLLGYAVEVGATMVRPDALTAVRDVEAKTRAELATLAEDRLERVCDPRRADLRLALIAGVAGIAFPVLSAALAGRAGGVALTLGAAAFVGVLAAIGWARVAVAAVLALALAVLVWPASAGVAGLGAPALPAAAFVAPSLLAAAGGGLAGLTVLYLRRTGLRLSAPWVAARLVTGLAAAGLGLLAAPSVPDIALIAALAVAGGLASLVLRSAVRRNLLQRNARPV